MANNQARTCELKCKYNVQGICHAYGECIAKDLFIAELESLREELNEKAEMHIDGHYYLSDEWIDEYINEHISELKGENNDIKN